MKRFAGILFLIFWSSQLLAVPQQLTDFSEIMKVLTAGGKVKAVIYYGKCSRLVDGKEQPAPENIGGMDIGTFEYFSRNSIGNPQGYLTFSHTSLIHNSARGFVYYCVKFKLREDNTVEIKAMYLRPLTFGTTMDETFTTRLNDGLNGGGLCLYAED